MNKNQIPEAFHPGEFIREEMEARGWAQVDLAVILGCKPNVVNDLLAGRRSVTPETAHDLSEAFGASAQYWLNLQSTYDLAMASSRSDDIGRKAKLYEKAPIREMQKRGWIEETNNLDVLETQICKLLRIDSIDDDVRFPHAARRSGKYNETTPSQIAWLARVLQVARTIDTTKNFEPDNFDQLMADLLPLKESAAGVQFIPEVLSKHGIRFLIVEHLPRTKIDGVCVWLDDSSPVIALSLRLDRIDGFWFSLMHELGHVKKGDGKDHPIIDSSLIGIDAQPGDEKPTREKRADKFASDSLIRTTDVDDFIARTHPLYSKKSVVGFSKRISVHPGITVGRLQHLRRIPYSNLRGMLIKIRNIVIEVALTDGWDRRVNLNH